MGSTITCKICLKEYPKNKISAHQLQCERIRIGKNEKKDCEICKKYFTMAEYYDHVLSHYKCEDIKENEVNPPVKFCDYNFSLNKIQRLTRIR